MTDDGRWHGVLRGSGPIPFRLAVLWVLDWAVLALFVWFLVDQYRAAGTPGSLDVRPFVRRWPFFVALWLVYGAKPMWTRLTALGLVPCAWVRESVGETVVARPWGVVGWRSARIVASGAVDIEMSRDRKIEFNRYVHITSGGRHLLITCPGPIAGDRVEELAQLLRYSGCAVTVRGSFDTYGEQPDSTAADTETL